MATGLAEAGADVVIVSRNEDELKSTAQDISESTGSRAVYVTADLSQRGEPQRVIERARELVGPIDILVNNAGSYVVQTIEEITDEAWDSTIELNLTVAMALTRAVVPDMSERLWGRIINISSCVAFRGRAGRTAYAVSKTGLNGLTRASARDLGKFGITVNAIAPGFFPSDLSARIVSEEVRDQYINRAVLGRAGKPDELLGAALLFASDAGSFITGQTLVVDGGLLLG
jgi:NAD(P)-dependent dehydrogenase (short-subunit alcohol dehydrogenase family)